MLPATLRPERLTGERATWIVGLIAAGVLGFGLGNGHTTQNSISAVSDNLGHCLYDRQHLSSAPAEGK